MRKYSKKVVKYTRKPLRIAGLGKGLPTKKKIYLMKRVCTLIKKIQSTVKKVEKGKLYGFNPHPFL